MKLTVNQIRKTIRGKVILNDVSMELEEHRVYGFVGRNGSGKTMLFRAVSGLMRIDSGTVYYDKKLLHRDMEVLPSLGIVIENVGLYNDLTGFRNLKKLAGYRKCISDDEIREALERVGLEPDDRRKYYKYSLGMKQRLAIAQAIMEHPEVIMLDEPTNGLDEEGVERFRHIILEERERGAIILLASHSREDIELLADQVYTMKEGVLQF